MKDLAIISYLTSRLGPLYQTKLYKILFYIDFCYYKNYWSSMTGCTYYKLPYWPVPLSIKTKIDSIIRDEEIEDQWIKKDIADYKKYLVIEPKDKNKFNIEWNYQDSMLIESEMKIIEYVIDSIGNLSTSRIVNKSHSEKAYTITGMFQPIFYGLSDSLSI